MNATTVSADELSDVVEYVSRVRTTLLWTFSAVFAANTAGVTALLLADADKSLARKAGRNLLLSNLLLIGRHLCSIFPVQTSFDMPSCAANALLTVVALGVTSTPLSTALALDVHHADVAELLAPTADAFLFLTHLLTLTAVGAYVVVTQDVAGSRFISVASVSLAALQLLALAVAVYAVVKSVASPPTSDGDDRRVSLVLMSIQSVVRSVLVVYLAATTSLALTPSVCYYTALATAVVCLGDALLTPATTLRHNNARVYTTVSRKSVAPFVDRSKSVADVSSVGGGVMNSSKRAETLRKSLRQGKRIEHLPSEPRKPIPPTLMMLVRPLQATITTLKRHPHANVDEPTSSAGVEDIVPSTSQQQPATSTSAVEGSLRQRVDATTQPHVNASTQPHVDPSTQKPTKSDVAKHARHAHFDHTKPYAHHHDTSGDVHLSQMYDNRESTKARKSRKIDHDPHDIHSLTSHDALHTIVVVEASG